MLIAKHCDKGQPTISETGDFGSMGKDYEITCPCGFKKRFPWMHQMVAVYQWNQAMEKVQHDA